MCIIISHLFSKCRCLVYRRILIMADEITGGDAEIARIAAQDQFRAAAEAFAGGQPSTEQAEREMMMRQGGIENVKAMVSTLESGETKAALKHIDPSINDEKLDIDRKRTRLNSS